MPEKSPDTPAQVPDFRDKEEVARDAYRARSVENAMMSGIYNGGFGLAVGIAATYAANALSPSFRKLNMSAKTALV